jgi:transcription elongation GreA/GreB family factor
MSVAFRRDSDEEHREPRFELPIPPGPNLVTQRGLELIRARIAELEAGLAAAEGDARETIGRDLRYWRTRAVTAVVAPPPPADAVGFGSAVAVHMPAGERRYRIVGDDEADPAAGLLAWSAPLAKVLMGAMAGERLAWGGKPDALEVLSVG